MEFGDFGMRVSVCQERRGGDGVAIHTITTSIIANLMCRRHRRCRCRRRRRRRAIAEVLESVLRGARLAGA